MFSLGHDRCKVSEMKRAEWAQEADELLRRDWCISAADAGIDDDLLARRWRDGETPAAFVAWFAEKYDLIPFEPLPVRRWPSTPRRSV
jgi:hypothetical protein